MNVIKVYEVYENGEYRGWYETEEQAKNYVEATENATYKIGNRYWG